jgi:hypothetical protein
MSFMKCHLFGIPLRQNLYYTVITVHSYSTLFPAERDQTTTIRTWNHKGRFTISLGQNMRAEDQETMEAFFSLNEEARDTFRRAIIGEAEDQARDKLAFKSPPSLRIIFGGKDRDRAGHTLCG